MQPWPFTPVYLCICVHIARPHRSCVYATDLAMLPIISKVAERVSGLVNVAVMDYAAAEYDLRASWTVGHHNLPQLRVFDVIGELPEPVSGMEKVRGRRTFLDMTAQQMTMKAQVVAKEVTTLIAGNRPGTQGARLKRVDLHSTTRVEETPPAPTSATPKAAPHTQRRRSNKEEL